MSGWCLFLGHWVRGGVRPGQVTSPPQRHMTIQMQGQFKENSYFNSYVFGLLEEAGVLRKNAHLHKENSTQNYPGWDLNPGPSGYKAKVPLLAPLCSRPLSICS
ncbi:hypothetical protein ATANTOWER_015866 [Ataeniobius toweri]|uniref:Uncharacterized protein n=1 Tax=Ataeniobius toweri TaxID=208326 RepID=A0ABU7BKC6_9TELE|nr:hypothetical protein [Ataeniobius toweri]